MSLWAIPEKITGEVEDMEFPGVIRGIEKMGIWIFQGLIKNNVEFTGVIKKK